MLIRTIVLTTLLFTASVAQAETSWFDAALEFIGLGPDKPKTTPATETMPKATEATKDDVMTQATQMAKDASTAMAKNAAMASLTGMVTDKLGVSEQQAQGGLGTLFGVAQSTLGSSEFSQLSQYVPEMDTLLKAAPAVSENADGISSLLGKAGKYGDALKSGSQAYSQFKTLGLDAAQIPQYIEITNEFLKQQGGTDIASLFSKGLAAIM